MSEDEYRKGYEDVKREIHESMTDDRGVYLATLEDSIKGLAKLPFSIIGDLLRSGDEDRGRADALNGRDYDYHGNND